VGLARPALADAGVWLVIPCYRVRDHVLRVLAGVPAWVEGVICVDDACPEGSGDFIEAECRDPRVRVLRMPANEGVGGATMAGYAAALERGARILVKVDGDDQMDLSYLPNLVLPILLGEADYAKGNRFASANSIRPMPRVRLFGNAGLSFLAKASSGYWQSFDPTNGYTALDGAVGRLLRERDVAKRFFFESDLLYHLGVMRAVVRDIPIPARYGDAVSNLDVAGAVVPFALRHARNFLRRLVGQYFLRDFNIATIEFLTGAAFLAFGGIYALVWILTRDPGQAATAGTVMAAALPVIIGVQLLLQALHYDVVNVPTRPIHPYLRMLEAAAAVEEP
jgi:glycosyltransferase involved in cell wall biosynthesis